MMYHVSQDKARSTAKWCLNQMSFGGMAACQYFDDDDEDFCKGIVISKPKRFTPKQRNKLSAVYARVRQGIDDNPYADPPPKIDSSDDDGFDPATPHRRARDGLSEEDCDNEWDGRSTRRGRPGLVDK